MKFKLIIFLIVGFFLIGLVGAFNVDTSSYEVDSFHWGSSGGDVATSSYEGRSTLTYEQSGSGNVTTVSYLANSGWFDVVFNIKEYVAPVVEEEEIASSSSGGGSGGGCASGYEYVAGKCVLKVNESVTNISGIPKELFDIRMDLEDTLIGVSSNLHIVVTYESFGTIPTLVNLTFEVFDLDGNLVYSKVDSIIVTTEEIRRYEFPDLELEDGEYEFVFTTLYNVDVVDEFRQKFSVGVKRGWITGNVVGFLFSGYTWWIVSFVLALIGLLWFVLWKRKKKKKKKKGRKYEHVYKKRFRGVLRIRNPRIRGKIKFRTRNGVVDLT